MTEATRNALLLLANADNAEEHYEALYEQVVTEVTEDDTPYRKVGCRLVQALLANDAEEVIKAITGWSIDDLLVRAGITPDTCGVVLGEEFTPPCFGCEYEAKDELGCCQLPCENCGELKAHIADIRTKVSQGTRVMLLADIEDIVCGKQNPNAPKANWMGTVTIIDDDNNIHVSWDNGGSLAIVPEKDKFAII